MTSYTFQFKGECAGSFTPAKTLTLLAKAFTCDPSDLENIFSGEAIFERQGLDKITAQAYQALFNKCGAVSYVFRGEPELVNEHQNAAVEEGCTSPGEHREESSLQNFEDITQCPKCDSSRIENGQCIDCGVYLHKVIQRSASEPPALPIAPKASSPDLLGGAADSDTSAILNSGVGEVDVDRLLNGNEAPPKRSAGRWLFLSSLAIIVLITSDEYLKAFYTPEIVGIDMGILPLILAHLGLVRGCFLFAKEQDLEPIYGLLGFLSIAGVAILSLLVSYRDTGSVRPKQLVFTIFAIGVVYYWSGNWSLHTEQFEKQFELSSSLPLGRNEYPSENLDSDSNIYIHEQQEMLEFLRQSLEYINSNSMRPDQVEKMANKTFHEFARYQAWRNYQYFLHASRGIELPSTFDKNRRESHHQQFRELLAGLVTREGSARLSLAYSEWTMGSTPDRTPVVASAMTRSLFNMYDKFRFGALNRNPQNTNIIEMNRVDLKRYALGLPRDVTAQFSGNIALFTFRDPRMGTEPLAVAFFWREERRSSRRSFNKDTQSDTTYVAEALLISPDFPYRYFTGYVQIFKNYEWYLAR